ncbi:MAG: UDP-N-acetylmuramoyl-tripeptide--D-alanyl-D-alanine ligase [Candidatus Marinimicrobia bacterium]|nr:UDP-N-acetylmuramoyl-tripeptide--D-alanyl-D-alanine ligase [Candidatus Neomarinimicrobiota bacterium]MCF7850113.1 UDP-N-acetylmuramoyl-tripeptide--D-alanyl-D-alanine ligase [Candidatus Neomarinimicrobiota bacterium]
MAIQHNTIRSLPDIQIKGAFSSPVSGISIDTRTLNAGELFVAFSGAQVDGHDFIPKAISRGASAVMASTHWDGIETWDASIPLILTEDSVKTLAELAHAHRMHFDIPVIAITGTNGKTTTKNLLAHILRKKYQVLSTDGNFNNHIGLPITLLNLNEKHEYAVLEMGASQKGDIKYLCDIAAPSQGLITNISMAHTEFFHDVDTIQKTKGELFDYLEANGGEVFVNLDDDRVAEIGAGMTSRTTFSFTEGADAVYSLADPDRFGSYDIKFQNTTAHLSHPGKALALNAAAATTIALGNAIEIDTVVEALQDYPGEQGRMQHVEVGSIHFLNDAYNANPASVRLGLETLGSLKIDARKILVFADMLELGEQSQELHLEVAEMVLEADFDHIFLYGIESMAIAQHLELNNYTSFYYNVEKAATIQRFLRMVSSGDLVYLKGSRGMKLEDFIQAYKERK